MKDKTRSAILAHAHAELAASRECCGLIVNAKGRERYVPCENLAPGGSHFAMALEAADAEDRDQQILAVVHSHPNAAPTPTQTDLVACERSGVPWVIVSVPTEQWFEFSPTGYKAPLLGREFSYGVLDCYTLWADWMIEEMGVEVPPRPPGSETPDWWKRGHAHELYLDGLSAAGWQHIKEGPQRGDTILIQLMADVANHCAVYLGDSMILHHVWGRLSCREIYGGYWRKHTRAIFRAPA